MKKLLVISLGLAFGLLTSCVLAQDKPAEKPKKQPSPAAQQRAERKALIEKYDANKSGRLDKQERAKMTPEEQAKWNAMAEANRAKAEANKAKAEEKKVEAEAKKDAAAAKKDATKKAQPAEKAQKD